MKLHICSKVMQPEQGCAGHLVEATLDASSGLDLSKLVGITTDGGVCQYWKETWSLEVTIIQV